MFAAQHTPDQVTEYEVAREILGRWLGRALAAARATNDDAARARQQQAVADIERRRQRLRVGTAEPAQIVVEATRARDASSSDEVQTSVGVDAAEHARIFTDDIVRNVFAGATADQPVVVLMGGQPGSGKSGLLNAATDHLSGTCRAVQIVGDDLRDYHPDYQRLLAADDRTAAAATDRDSGRWVQLCLEHARAHRYPVVVEGTMRDSAVPLSTAAAFRQAGYRVEAWVMAVDPLSSRLGILARYHAQRQAFGIGRFTTDAAHDAGVAGVLASVAALQDSGLVDRIVVAARGPRVIAESAAAAMTPRLRELLHGERTRPWRTSELTEFTARAHRIAASVPAGHDHHRLVEDLVTAATHRTTTDDNGPSSRQPVRGEPDR